MEARKSKNLSSREFVFLENCGQQLRESAESVELAMQNPVLKLQPLWEVK